MISDEARRFRQLLDEVVEEHVTVGIGHGVQVVEHDDELLAEGRDRVRQLVDRRFERAPGDLEALQGAAAETAPDPIDGRRHVAPHPVRIVVAPVERHPGGRGSAAPAPGAHRGRLAVSRQRRHECQGHALGSVERARESWPLDRLRVLARHAELGLRQWKEQIGGARAAGVSARFGPSLLSDRLCDRSTLLDRGRPVPTPSTPPIITAACTGGVVTPRG